MEKFLNPSQEKLYKVASICNITIHIVVFAIFFLVAISTDLVVFQYYSSLADTIIEFLIWVVVVGIGLCLSYIFMSVKIETFKNTSIIASSKSSEESPKIDFHTTLMSED